MLKKLLIGYLFVIQTSFAQVNLGFSNNLDVYKPYTPLTQEYMKVNKNITSNTWQLYINYDILTSKRWTWSTGLTYKHILHKIHKRLLGFYDYTVHHGSGSELIITYYYVDQALDYNSRSKSLGFYNEVNYKIVEKNKQKAYLGLINETYLFEKFYAAYYISGTNKEKEKHIYTYFYSKTLPRSFFLSSVNLSLYYKHVFQLNDKLSFSPKLSIGTNLYSDWDQFKKYAWIGLGVEVGFGKKKVKVEN